MSKIYQALKSFDVEAADAILEAIDHSDTSENEADVEPPVESRQATVEVESEEAGETAATPPPFPVTALIGPQKPRRRYRVEPIALQAGLPLLPFDGSDPRSAEQYRIIRTNLLHHAQQPKVVAISSAASGDGKTVSTINIAGTLALRQDISVLLIDADMRRGNIAPLLGLQAETGLADVLRGECSLERAIIQTEQFPQLFVLPSGRASCNPAELLDSDAWRRLIAASRERFRFTIIDTTPIAMVTDFDLIQVVSDGIVMVVRPEHTNRKLWQKSIQAVEKAKLLGTVMNCVDDWFLWRQNSYYYASDRE